MDLEYYYVLGETLPEYHFHKLIYPDAKLEDIFINLDNLAEILEFAGIQKY